MTATSHLALCLLLLPTANTFGHAALPGSGASRVLPRAAAHVSRPAPDPLPAAPAGDPAAPVEVTLLAYPSGDPDVRTVYATAPNRSLFLRFVRHKTGAAAVDEGIVERRLDAREDQHRRLLEHAWGEGLLLAATRDPVVGRPDARDLPFGTALDGYVDRVVALNATDKASGLGARLRAVLAAAPAAAARYDAARDGPETLAVLKTFLEWFRDEFPYYYDGCEQCGNGCGNFFLGYVCGSEPERRLGAARTELFACGACGATTRFARYTNVAAVLGSRRGRCGEYSWLLYRMLQALGYEQCRWVVDWADHVWAEVAVDGRWVHLDPCEAAVDEPLIYESWGKNCTHIVAFNQTAAVDVVETYTADAPAARARGAVPAAELEAALRAASDKLRRFHEGRPDAMETARAAATAAGKQKRADGSALPWT